MKITAGALTACVAFGVTTAAASAAGRSAIVADVPPLPAVTDLGRAPRAARVDIAITLRYRDEPALERLVELQADPHSPLYGRFLSNAQFNASFAPARADYTRVAGVLQRSGFRVTHTFANGTVIDATGTAGAADQLFATDIHLVNQAGHGVRYVNVTPGREPAVLRGLIMSVSGLHSLTLNGSHLATVTPRAQQAPDLAGSPLRGPVSKPTGMAGFGPLAFSQGYLFPEQFNDGNGRPYDGSGRATGVVIDADFIDTDLAAFLAYFNVTRTGPATVRVPVDGGPPVGDGSIDSLQTTLDVETVVSNAPGTALYVYEFPNFNRNSYITDAYNTVVDDNLVDTANSSFSGCETNEVSDDRAWDAIALQGASKGITFHASSGDGGSNECVGGGVSAPASGPHFAAVGGTTLVVTSTGTWLAESAWSASSGGVSKVFALPAWQKPVPNIITGGRNLPDVAYDANPNTGVAFYYDGSWNSIYDPLGGTSLSSPLFGAALTEYDEYLGRRAGLAAETLYADLLANGYGSPQTPYFHDITIGSNGRYRALPGYDRVTGIGSAVIWNILTL